LASNTNIRATKNIHFSKSRRWTAHEVSGRINHVAEPAFVVRFQNPAQWVSLAMLRRLERFASVANESTIGKDDAKTGDMIEAGT